MNYPILGNRAVLAILADADEESARAATAYFVLYTSKAGERVLIDTLDLITSGYRQQPERRRGHAGGAGDSRYSAWRSAGL